MSLVALLVVGELYGSFSGGLIYRNNFVVDKALDICGMEFTGNPLTLIGHSQTG
jgi:hypothetical protein